MVLASAYTPVVAAVALVADSHGSPGRGSPSLSSFSAQLLRLVFTRTLAVRDSPTLLYLRPFAGPPSRFHRARPVSPPVPLPHSLTVRGTSRPNDHRPPSYLTFTRPAGTARATFHPPLGGGHRARVAGSTSPREASRAPCRNIGSRREAHRRRVNNHPCCRITPVNGRRRLTDLCLTAGKRPAARSEN